MGARRVATILTEDDDDDDVYVGDGDVDDDDEDWDVTAVRGRPSDSEDNQWGPTQYDADHQSSLLGSIWS